MLYRCERCVDCVYVCVCQALYSREHVNSVEQQNLNTNHSLISQVVVMGQQ